MFITNYFQTSFDYEDEIIIRFGLVSMIIFIEVEVNKKKNKGYRFDT